MSLWIFLLYFCAIFYFHPNFCMFGFGRQLHLSEKLNDALHHQKDAKEAKETKEQSDIQYEKEIRQKSPRKYNENAKK